MAKFKYLTYDDRLNIEKMYKSGMSTPKIANALGKNYSTVYRELHRYLYTERLGRMKFPEQFYKDMKEQYEKTENISQTLDLLAEQYPKGKVAKRLRASKDYLKNSHYKDYETALYRYLSDSDTANVITEILLKDLQKICRIPCKQEKNTGEENKK